MATFADPGLDAAASPLDGIASEIKPKPGPISLALVILATTAFFAVLWSLDFPKPMVDDLFYSGASLNLAGGGDFSNPFLARQGFPGHYFLIYPPLHSYALAGWLKLFGISAAAMTAYPIFNCLVMAIATVVVLRRRGAARWLEWLVPLGVGGALLKTGLRAESLALALTMTGLAALAGNRAGKFRLFCGFALMALGTATAPRTGPYSAVLMLGAGHELWRESTATGWRRWSFCAPAIAGMAAACLIFLVLIDFRVGEFAHAFLFHAQSARGGALVLLKRFWVAILGFALWPVLLLWPVFLFLAWRKPLDAPGRMGFWLAGAFPLMALIGDLYHGTIWFAMLSLFFLAASVSQTAGSRRKAVAGVLILAVMLLANSRTFVNAAGMVSGKIQSAAGDERAAALALRSTPEHPVLLDGAAARYVYNYRIPPGFVDWEFAAPFPGELATDVNLRPGDIYVLGPVSMDVLTRRTHWEQKIPTWTPFGSPRWSYPQFPRRPFIVPADACGGLRGGPLM